MDTIFYAALYPLVPYFEEEFGLSKSVVGILSGAYGAGVLVGSVPGGYLASRSGVRITALVGLILMSATSVMFALVDTTWLLVAVRFVGGFGSALSWVAAFTWLVDRTPEERRAEMIGVMVSAAVVGALLGPVLGSVAATVGLLPAFAFIAIVGGVIAVWAALEQAPVSSGDISLLPALRTVRQPLLLTSLWFIGLSPLLFSALAVLVPLDLNRLGWGAAAVGTVFFVSAVFEAFVHPLLGRWSDRSGYRPPIFAGLLTTIGILILLTWVGNPWLIGLLVVLAAGPSTRHSSPGRRFSHAALKRPVWKGPWPSRSRTSPGPPVTLSGPPWEASLLTSGAMPSPISRLRRSAC